MISPKRLGLAIMIAGPLMGAAYAIGILIYRLFAVEVTALTFILLLLGIVTWIGYTMFTEPTTTRPLPSEADIEDMKAETINPPPGGRDSLRTTRSSFSVVTDCSIGEGTVIRDQVNLFKCSIGRDCKIESFVYIEEGVTIGDRCKIKPNVYIPTGVTIGDDVFIGPNATFTNDKHPRVNGDWQLLETVVGKGAAIGAHSVILPGLKIGENAIIGAGAVVTKDIPANSIAIGNPARVLAKSTVVHEKLVK